MPTPFNSPTTLHRERGYALKRPECAQRIGAIVLEWSHLERVLATMFSATIGTKRIDAQGNLEISRQWTAIAVMSEIDSLHLRLQIIRTTLIDLLPERLRSQWSPLERELRRSAKLRNMVAHGLWSYAREYPNDLVLSLEGGGVVVYTPVDFDEILRDVGATLEAVDRFRASILDAVKSGEFSPPN